MPGSMPQELYRAAFEHAVDAVVALADDRSILAANNAAATLFAVPREQLVGRSSAEFYGATDGQAEEIWRELGEGRSVRREVRIRLRDGKVRDIEVTTQGHVVRGVHIAILRDVTERNRKELVARRYELLREHTEDVLLFIATDGRIVEANRAAEKAYGFTREELLGMNILALRHDSTLDELAPQFERASREPVRFETVHRRKDGSPFPVEVASRPARIGDSDLLLSVIRDATERRALHAKLLEADRVWTFGMMAAGIAHEINNPLAYALANAEVLARLLPDLSRRARAVSTGDAPHEELTNVVDDLSRCEAMLGVATEGLERVRSIVRDLKMFSRSDPEEGVLVDLHQVLDAALNVAHGELRHRATITRAYGEPPPVRGSSSRLGQVFLNLLVNAAQAIPRDRARGGQIRLETSQTATGWAKVVIADDGAGIPLASQARLFEPFQTTKRGEGTGLGLYISRTIIEAHGGRIAITSREGDGTEVTVYVPPYAPSRHPSAPASSARSVRRRVLVVDDEIEIGAAIRALLAPHHDVEVATSVAGAMAMLGRDGAFDVVLCDVMMPVASGLDLLAAVTTRYPHLATRFLFMTGGILDDTLRELTSKSRIVCLEKPLTTLELLQAISKATRRA